MNVQDSLDYLEKNSIRTIFESLTSNLIMHQPEDALRFMSDCIAKYREVKQISPLATFDSVADQVSSTSSSSSSSVPVAQPRAVAAIKEAEVVKKPMSPVMPMSPLTKKKSESFRRETEVGCASDRNGKPMEDEYVTYLSEGGSLRAFFGVFDGHSSEGRHGRLAAVCARNNLFSLFMQAYDKHARENPGSDLSFTSVFQQAYSETENILKREQGYDFAGTTATTCVLWRSKTSYPLLYIANVGDSSAVLGGPRFCEVVSVDHNVSNQAEVDRSVKAGAFYSDDVRFGGKRVDGMTVTRSIGDFSCVGALCEPSVRGIQLTQEHTVLIVASDGLWNHVSPTDAVSITLVSKNKGEPSFVAADNLLQLALQRSQMPKQHRDNISVLVVYL